MMCICIPQHSEVYLPLIHTLRKVIQVSTILSIFRALLNHTITTEAIQLYEAIGAVAWKYPMIGTTTAKGFVKFDI